MQNKDLTNQQDTPSSDVPATAPSTGSALDRLTAAVSATASELGSTVVPAIAQSTGSILGRVIAPVAAASSRVADELSNRWASWDWPWNTSAPARSRDNANEILGAFHGLPQRPTEFRGSTINFSNDRTLMNVVGGWDPENPPTPSLEAMRLVDEGNSAYNAAEQAFPAYQEPSQQTQQIPATNVFSVQPVRYNASVDIDSNQPTDSVKEDRKDSDKSNNNGL